MEQKTEKTGMKNLRKIQIYLTAMKNRATFILGVGYLVLIIHSCHGQIGGRQVCNRNTVDASLTRQLPRGICIPKQNTVDEIIRHVDFNRDGKLDVVVRYGTYPLMTGAKRSYGFFERVSDTIFVLKKEFTNLTPPYLKNIYAAMAGGDSLELSLAQRYPYDASVQFARDTIRISHLIPDFYGKTYVFVFDTVREDWYLKFTEYWIGGIDERDITEMNLSPKLSRRNILEKSNSTTEDSLDAFNLVDSRRKGDNEEKAYLTNVYNLLEWSNRNKN